ncbi:glycosyltransferase family 4 protein [Fimbriimonas ginsengisoli]|uniref:Group 1 glycosyl transferase n=1 Tax=Fimbriimonas ginsengisoli Gsoil 348 TaxID=661478 RepID=A0A068NY44_FIMGI|nr:glycosyltransferase family 4 protein [Fimbriimonas ginsengisoli]AIE86629.1 group 1 glycosyl transferase [Fimbriimonas ginsengisoli Gsoil 348]
MSRRIWVVSELYYPERTSTGRVLTATAEALARTEEVHVLCAQPTYDAKGVRALKRETHNGAKIVRCSSTTFPRTVLPLRAINALSLTLSTFFHALFGVKRGDVVLVVTNPPTLPFIVQLACRLKGAPCVLLVHDVYPESLARAGLTSEEGFAYRLIDKMSAKLISRMRRVIVLGRDVPPLLEARLKRYGKNVPPMDLVPNYGDVDEVQPMPRVGNRILAELGVADRFVIQYAGNMGRTHGLQNVLTVLERLREDPRAFFLFVGSGAFKKRLEDEVREHKWSNVAVSSYRPIEELSESLAACDVALITFAANMEGVSVPSRMYNVMASARTIIGVCGEESELGLVIREHRIGWIAKPDDPESLIQTIAEAMATSAEEREAMGRRAREAVERLYTPEHTFSKTAESLRAAV